jgi:hypothetical protein
MGAPLESGTATCKFIPISVTKETTDYDQFINKNSPIEYSLTPPPHIQPAWMYIDPSATKNNNTTKHTEETKVPEDGVDTKDNESNNGLLNELKTILDL